MGGRYGGDIKGRRRGGNRAKLSWTPPPKPKDPVPSRPIDARWVALSALAWYSVVLGLLPLML